MAGGELSKAGGITTRLGAGSFYDPAFWQHLEPVRLTRLVYELTQSVWQEHVSAPKQR
jgi:hypothetical protein